MQKQRILNNGSKKITKTVVVKHVWYKTVTTEYISTHKKSKIQKNTNKPSVPQFQATGPKNQNASISRSPQCNRTILLHPIPLPQAEQRLPSVPQFQPTGLKNQNASISRSPQYNRRILLHPIPLPQAEQRLPARLVFSFKESSSDQLSQIPIVLSGEHLKIVGGKLISHSEPRAYIWN